MHCNQNTRQVKVIEYNGYLQMYSLTWIEFNFKRSNTQLLHIIATARVSTAGATCIANIIQVGKHCGARVR